MPCPCCGRLIIEPVKLHPIHIAVCEECGKRFESIIEQNDKVRLEAAVVRKIVADALEGE